MSSNLETKFKPSITLTFGECAENHTGMQRIGSSGRRGFTCDELKDLANRYHGAEYHILNTVEQTKDAGILIWRNFLDEFVQ